MKRLITLFAAALMLCCMTVNAQPVYIKSANANYTSTGNTGITDNWNAPAGTTAMVVCLEGDTIAGGHDDISEVSWNSENFTLVKKYTTPDGSHSNNRMLYMYKLISPTPTDGTVHNLVLKSTNSHYLLAAVANYGGVGNVGGGGGYSVAYAPVSGTVNPTTFSGNMQTLYNGSWMVMCEGNSGSSQIDNGHAYLRTNGGGTFNFPTLYDTGGPVYPQRPSNNEYTMYFSLNPTTSDAAWIMAELLPTTAYSIPNVFGAFSATNSWVLTGANSGLPSCDYATSAWDTTTSPWTNLTSSITSNTCNGTTYDVTVGFAGNQTGVLQLTPNPNKCGSGSC